MSSPKSELASRCPLCGELNGCRLADQGLHKGPCWCEKNDFPPELLAKVSTEALGKRCVCESCLASYKARAWDPRPRAGEYYIETARMVFTEAYHRRRGYCCGSGCRHCPFERPNELISNERTAGAGQAVACLLVIFFLVLDSARARARADVVEDFSRNPALNGWINFGDSSLYNWNAANQNLQATWDSRLTNSAYALPFGATLTSSNTFAADFDLTLFDYGPRPDAQGPLQIALGFINLPVTTANDGNRTSGSSEDELEFDFFPQGEFGPPYGISPSTISPIIFGDHGQIRAGFSPPLAWATNHAYHIRIAYDGSQRRISTSVDNGGDALPFTAPDVVLDSAFGNFAVNAFAVLSWNEAPSTGSSVLAHGVLDNLRIEGIDSPLASLIISYTNSVAAVSFDAKAGWNYLLQSSGDLKQWSSVATNSPSVGGSLSLTDAGSSGLPRRFYRVQAYTQ